MIIPKKEEIPTVVSAKIAESVVAVIVEKTGVVEKEDLLVKVDEAVEMAGVEEDSAVGIEVREAAVEVDVEVEVGKAVKMDTISLSSNSSSTMKHLIRNKIASKKIIEWMVE